VLREVWQDRVQEFKHIYFNSSFSSWREVVDRDLGSWCCSTGLFDLSRRVKFPESLKLGLQVSNWGSTKFQQPSSGQTLSVPFFSRTTTHDGKHGGHIRQSPQRSHYILCGYWICFPWKQGHWLYPAAAQPFRSKWEERTLPQHPQSFHNMTLMIENSSAYMDQREPGQ
jgi:hypothetical protein